MSNVACSSLPESSWDVWLAARTASWRPLQQISGFDTKCARQAINHINTGIVDAALKGADIGAIDARAVGQVFLGDASLLAKGPQIASKHLSYLHK